MRFAGRMQQLGASPIRELFDLGRRIPNAIDLSIGQVGFEVPPAVREAAVEAVRTGTGRYSATEGHAHVVAVVRAHLEAGDGLGDGDEVMLTVGATGALTLAYLALAGPGDEVLVPDPHFVVYRNLTHIVGATPVFYDTYPDFEPNADDIAPLITPRTRMLVLNSPSNPTGRVFSQDCLTRIARLCADRGVPIVSDELHGRFVYERELVSIKRVDHSNSLLIGGLSKSYAMAGWRMGWAAGPAALIDRMRMLQQFTYTCPPTLVQATVEAALACDVSPWVEAHRRKRDLVYNALVQAGYEVTKPGGTIFMYPKVPAGTDLEFCRRALERKLILVPGRAFSRRSTHFRICIGPSEETLERGLEVLIDLASSK